MDSDKVLCFATIVAVLVFILLFYVIWAQLREKGMTLRKKKKLAKKGFREAKNGWERSMSVIFGAIVLSKGGNGALLGFFGLVITTTIPAMCNVAWFEWLFRFIVDHVQQATAAGKATAPIGESPSR